MKNVVYLRGTICVIQPSHLFDGVQYYKAFLNVVNSSNRIPIVFKRNCVEEGQEVSIYGNIRSHTHQVNNRKVTDVYVYTDFVIQEDCNNFVYLEGNICKVNSPKVDSKGNKFQTFIVANNQFPNNRKINNYIPFIVYSGNVCYDALEVGDIVGLSGELTTKGNWCEVQLA